MCGPLFLTVASFGLLSVGACLGFLTAALFAAGAEPADLPKPKKVVSIPDDSAEMVWQAAASLYTLGACLREGENPSGAMADCLQGGSRTRLMAARGCVPTRTSPSTFVPLGVPPAPQSRLMLPHRPPGSRAGKHCHQSTSSDMASLFAHPLRSPITAREGRAEKKSRQGASATNMITMSRSPTWRLAPTLSTSKCKPVH